MTTEISTVVPETTTVMPESSTEIIETIIVPTVSMSAPPPFASMEATMTIETTAEDVTDRPKPTAGLAWPEAEAEATVEAQAPIESTIEEGDAEPGPMGFNAPHWEPGWETREEDIAPVWTPKIVGGRAIGYRAKLGLIHLGVDAEFARHGGTILHWTWQMTGPKIFARGVVKLEEHALANAAFVGRNALREAEASTTRR